MPVDHRTAAAGLVMSLAVGAVAIALAFWLWFERKNRSDELPEEDLQHFRRQDLRRFLVALILMLIAVGLSAGSRIAPKVEGRTNLLFVEIWFGVFILILALLVLAFFDWIATKIYARRQFRALANERLEILREELSRNPKPRESLNGFGDHFGESNH
ncbi:hypothetical protein ACYOEI_05020 [Singulisphaera rosea]